MRSRWCTRRRHMCLARFLAELKAPSSLCLPFAGSLLGACHQSQSMQQAMHTLAPCSTMHHVGCRTKWAINSVLYVGGLATNVLRALCTAWGNAVCILHAWMLHIPCMDAAYYAHGYCTPHAWGLPVHVTRNRSGHSNADINAPLDLDCPQCPQSPQFPQ